MNQRKGILQFLKNCLSDLNYNKEIGGRKHARVLTKEIISDYFKHCIYMDIGKFCNHEERFRLLYIERNDFTFSKMAEHTNSGEQSFKTWVRKYNQEVLYFVERESKTNPHYAFILSEYLKSGL